MNTEAQALGRSIAAQDERDPDEIDLLQYWNVLRANLWLVAGVAGTVVALAIVMTLLATPVFRASSLLQIERESLQVVNVEGVMPTEQGYYGDDFYQTQYELLASNSLALRVVQDLNLTQDPYFKPMLEGVGEKAPAAARQQEMQRTLADMLLGEVSIEPVRNSRLVRINVDSPDPKVAARVADAWSKAYIASNLERRFEASSYARKYLEERLAQLKGKLEDSEKALVSFATQEQIVSVGDGKPSLSAQNLSELNASLARAQDERIRAEAEWTQASQGEGAGLPQVTTNSLIQRLREERSKVQAEYQEKLRTFKPDYPDMQRLSGQIAEIDRQIAGEVANIRASIKARYDAAVAQEGLLDARIGGLKGDVLDLQSRSIQYNILQREAETNRQLYDGLLQRYKEIGVAGGVGANNIFVVDRAEVPADPYKPSLFRNLALGLLVGGMLGVLAAFARHYLDRTIHSPKALESLIQRPVLGMIPRLGGGMTPAQASVDLRSPFAEAYRSVRTALQFATAHGLPYSLLVSSAGPGEGKTTTAMELARNIAQLGKRVVVVDADLRNPSVHKLLGVSNSVGLSNVLAGASGVEGAVQATKDPNLSVITSGPLPPNPPELLAGDGLAALLESLRQHFDMVVLDGPPVLGLADAPLLGHRAEATLLVATAEQTRTDALQGAMQRLMAARARVLGSVLTRFDMSKGDNYGYGGYSYYSYGGDKP
ncbi:GumC family protein [Lysobacter niabensis]|uniref:GumC family protein n=1 Tax=Agrilutibacter niabensis TaxID=380628 RepID=UPI0036181501